MENAQDVVETAIVLDWNFVANVAVGTCAGIVGSGAVVFALFLLLGVWKIMLNPYS